MKKEYDDDDGRVIADMSEIGQPNVLSGLVTVRKPPSQKKNIQSEKAKDKDKPKKKKEEQIVLDGVDIDKKTRKLFIFGSLRASLLIGLIYLAAFALLIVIMLLIMGRL